MTNRFRNWCFTINNPDVRPQKEFNDEWWNRFDHLKYGVVQLEVGDKGTIHLQGYAEFDRAITGAAIHRAIPTGHHERRVGSRDQARDYCRKTESRIAGPWEFGEWKSDQGKRTDLERVRDMIDEGKEEAEIASEEFGAYVKYFKGIREYKKLKESVRDWLTEWEIHVGVPGTGKTELVKANYPEAYWKDTTKWWDYYEGQDVVVLDEFHGYIPYHQLLRLGDSTPLPVEFKGGSKQFLGKKVVLISNKFPWEWYAFEEHKLEKTALFRRIGEIYYHRKDKDPKVFLDWNDFVEYCSLKGLVK